MNASSSKKLINDDIEKKIFFLLIILTFTKMLVLNFITPLMSDDFGYASSASVLVALQQEYEHYMSWGGRSVVHFVVRIFLMAPKEVFNIFSALVYAGLTIMMYKAANPFRKHNISLYLFIVFSIWLYTINYGQAVLWLTGSINYLWGSFIILCFLSPYILYINNSRTFSGKYAPIVCMFFLGILAGWCNENTSGGAILFTVFAVIFCIIFKQKIQKWMITGMIGSVIGFLLMILAPGNAVRSLHFTDNRHTLVLLANRVNSLTNVLRNDFAVLIAVFIVLIIMQILINKDRKRIYISFAYFITSIVIVYAMVLSPTMHGGRAMFGATIFMVMACAHCYAGLSFEAVPYKIAAMSFISILAFQFTTTFIGGVVDLGLTFRETYRRQRHIESQIEQGSYNITVKRITRGPATKYNAWPPPNSPYDVTDDAEHSFNRDFARYYGIESIRAED